METVEKMGMQERRQIHNKHNEHKRELTILALLAAAVLALAFCCLFAGSSHMSFRSEEHTSELQSLYS